VPKKLKGWFREFQGIFMLAIPEDAGLNAKVGEKSKIFTYRLL
jgi:hypothetical protein